MVEDPWPRHRARRNALVQGAVDIPADRVQLPLDREHVKRVREGPPCEVVGAGDTIRTGAACTGHCAVPGRGLLSDVLHDVDLAAPGPADPPDVEAQHPERGPQPLSSRNLNARLDAAEPQSPQTLGLEARRRVRAVAERLLPRLDYQIAVLEVCILDPIGIVLELGISPATASRVPCPFRGVERGAVELIVPHELPRPGRLRRVGGSPGGTLLAGAAREGGPNRRQSERDYQNAGRHESSFAFLRSGVKVPRDSSAARDRHARGGLTAGW